jgi:hypothetical protein
LLRDIITRHRRAWAAAYLPDYLRARWTTELSTVADELNRHVAVKGRTPTYKQFARFAYAVANHWFNGDLAGLYAAIGEKAPATARRVDLLPGTARDFVRSVYAALGGTSYGDDLRINNFPDADRQRQLARLATASLRYLQISEALGREPEPTEFGAGRYEWGWADNQADGWSRYPAGHPRRPTHRSRRFADAERPMSDRHVTNRNHNPPDCATWSVSSGRRTYLLVELKPPAGRWCSLSESGRYAISESGRYAILGFRHRPRAVASVRAVRGGRRLRGSGRSSFVGTEWVVWPSLRCVASWL